MKNRYYVNGDLHVPRLGMGTWQLEGDQCQQAVEDALDVGYRHLDTAQMYENEDRVGDALRAANLPREDVWITTKVANENHSRDDLLASTERSLQALGVDELDLLLLHWPMDDESRPDTLEALDEAQKAGLTRFVGVSNFLPEQVREARAYADLANVQVEHHVYLEQDEMRDLAEEFGMFLTAYSPLARGGVGEDPVLKEIGQRHGAIPEQVALAWLLHEPNVVVIPKATTRSHLETNAAALHCDLTPAEVARINTLPKTRRIIDPEFAPDWQ